MISKTFSKFVTNNHRFKPSDSDYGKVYLVNIFLLALVVICFTYFILNCFVEINIYVMILNLTGLLLAVAGGVYFHRTDKINVINGFSVGLLLVLIFAYLIVSEHSHQSLYWLVVIPPVVFFLLGHRRARLVSFIYFCLVAIYIAVNYDSWAGQGFNSQAFLNIIGPILVLVFLISFYERSRFAVSKELGIRNVELAKTISDLSDNKEKLEVLLASTEEGIYGINLEGKCMFCNKSGLTFLGYNEESQLLGENMHSKIHSKDKAGNAINIKDCKIYNVFNDSKVVRVNDEVFWKADGSPFDVEYAASPQYKDGHIIGAVISFRDIAQEKAALERMQYLNSHDWLTGLYNRNYFETLILGIDRPENLPISIIFADINGLKLTNDIFGHQAGDQLLLKGAEVLRAYQRDQDLLARVGGDEFAMVLPRTSLEEAQNKQKEIQKQFSTYSVNSIPCSMAVGCAASVDDRMPIAQTIANAEGEMYKEKTTSRQTIHDDMLYTLINLLHKKSPREKTHSENVMKYTGMMGTALKLPTADLARLKKMAYFHDIGKIVLEDELLMSEDVLSKEGLARMKQHPAIAYRILNLFDETLDIAAGIYSHHENWDGTGYPRGLKKEEIPYMARIISVAEVYDGLTNKIGGNSWTKEKALEEIKAMSGIKMDPEMVRVFLEVMKEKNTNSLDAIGALEEAEVV